MISLPQIERREIEAEMLAQVYETLVEDMGEDKALDIIHRTVTASARKAGALFASKAPGGPSLGHFATITRVWSQGGAIDLDVLSPQDGVFKVTVTRCGYADLYLNTLKLPRKLACVVSCARDGAFAEGYSPKLTLERPCTIAAGDETCDFTYRWQE